MKIILLSYSSIEYAIALYKKHKSLNEDVKFIVFNNKNIVRFLEYIKIESGDIVYYSYKIEHTRNIFRYIKELISSKAFFEKNIQSINNEVIYLFNKNECVEIFDMFYKIRNKNYLKYVSFDPDITYKNRSNIFCIMYKIYYSLFVSLPYKTYYLSEQIITMVDDRILKSFEVKKDPKLLLASIELSIPKTKVIMLETDLASAGLCDIEKFKDTSRKIYNEVNIKFQENISIKPHPVFSNVYYDYKLDNNNCIQDFIPFEFLLDKNNCEIVIGATSIALLSAIKCNVRYVISTILIFDYLDQEEKQKAIEWLKDESDNKILFPRSIEELISILNFIKEMYYAN